MGLTINVGSGAGALQLLSVYHGAFRDLTVTGTAGSSNTAILLGVNTSGGSNPAGNLNSAFTTFDNIAVTQQVGTALKMIGDSATPTVVTLNTFLNVRTANVSVYGIELNSWTDNNTFVGVRIGTSSATNTSAVGVIMNSGTPGSDVGVYTNNFYDLSVDCFGAPSGDTRVGVKMNLTKLNEIILYQSPVCAGGAYTTASTQNTRLKWFNGPFGAMEYQIGNLTGAPSTQANGRLSPLNYVWGSDAADAVTNGPGLLVGGEFELAPQAGFKGGRTALQGWLAMVGTPAATSAVGYVGSQGIVTDNSNLLGTNLASYGNAAGSIYAGNFEAQAKNGATFLTLVDGLEVDSSVTSGASTADHYGISIVEEAIHATTGTFDDSALSFGNQDGVTAGWNYGISFGAYAHHWPFTTTSTLIGAQLRQVGGAETDNALNGVDFRNVTFAGGGKAFASPGFAVDNLGNVAVGTTSAPTVTIAASSGNVANLVLAGNGNAASAALVVTQGGTNNVNINNKANGSICVLTNNAQGVCQAASTAFESLGTTFTLGSGTGACSTTSTLVGGVQAGSFLCTGTAGASTQVVNLPAAAHAWACWANDDTSGVAWAAKSTGASAITLSGAIATTSDKVVFGCLGY